MPTSQRDQVLVAVGVMAILGAAAYWYLVDTPQRAAFVAKQAHIDTLNAGNQSARAQLARGNVAQIKAEAESLRANLDVMRQLVPVSNEVPALIEQVSNAARRVRLDLAGIDPQPPIEGEMFDTYRYQVKLNGSYHEIAQVLANIASLNRVVAPINLSLELATAPGGRQTPGRQYLNSIFLIQTYVVRTAPRAAPPGAPGAPGAPAAKPPGDQ